MMAFRKLYFIRHRRTDYYRLERWMWEMMHPEYLEEVRQRGEKAEHELRKTMAALLTASSLVNSVNRCDW